MREKVYEYQERDMACIVLENCGNRLPSFDCLSYDQRYDNILISIDSLVTPFEIG